MKCRHCGEWLGVDPKVKEEFFRFYFEEKVPRLELLERFKGQIGPHTAIAWLGKEGKRRKALSDKLKAVSDADVLALPK